MLESETRTGSPQSDAMEGLLLRAGQGDEEAFAELYDQIAHRVYGLVLRVVDDPAQAEQVTSEVLLETWRTSARFDPGAGSALGWIVAQAHQRAIDCVRDTGSAHQRPGPRDQADISGTSSRDPRQSRSITLALATLPFTQRRAVELAYFDGYTCADVSRLLQVSRDATLTVIRTALLGLRRHADQAS